SQGSVLGAAAIARERRESDGGVFPAAGVAPERKVSVGGVVGVVDRIRDAGGDLHQRAGAPTSVAVGIAGVVARGHLAPAYGYAQRDNEARADHSTGQYSVHGLLPCGESWLFCPWRSELYSGGSAKVNGKEAVRGSTAGGSASRPTGLPDQR